MTDSLHLFQEHFLQPKNSHLWDPNDLLFNLRDGIYVIDADGKILYANPAFAQLAGYMGTESIIG
ncbi:MAG: PAS domain-containing protein, partial [Sphaerochaetaceae bacterium]|nr:PAS domain-containing protein [Sphaerochaetaceae bacterium]